MKRRPEPLLCELHAHTTWSDGELSLPAVVDLYGRNGFDVLCVTDHACRDGSYVSADSFAGYLGAIAVETNRARAIYDMLVVPGLELTYDDADPARGAHVVAIGLETFVPLDGELEDVLRAARDAGAALIAAHPYEEPDESLRRTGRFAADWETLGPLVDRAELFNRDELFAWVAGTGVAAVATGDFHSHDHLATWKTLLPCARDVRSVVDYLRSPMPCYITRLEPARRESLAA
jgi:processive 1,2-diacylglycerol beta-glucosyltransferase